MKRPTTIYYLAVWSFVVLVLQTNGLSRIAASYLPDGQVGADLLQGFRGLLFILVVWHVIQLVQLQAFNRWLSFGSFIWATISMTWLTYIVCRKPEVSFRAVVFCATFALLSLGGGIYLAKPSFREFATRYVAERRKARHSRTLREIYRGQASDDMQS